MNCRKRSIVIRSPALTISHWSGHQPLAVPYSNFLRKLTLEEQRDE